MPKVRVAGFGVSLDGFSAGIEQSLSDPLGKRGTEIFQWFFRTETFRAMHAQEGGVADTDDEFARKAMDNFGAFILGRNMFGPVRGPWLDRSWKGWWGDNPPYHTPTFVLTHYDHEPLVMAGGTTFYFVTGGIEEALKLAKQAGGDKDVKIGGGVSTVRQYLRAGLIDSLQFALSPVVLGRGEPLFADLDLPALGFSVTEHTATDTRPILYWRELKGRNCQRSPKIGTAKPVFSVTIENRQQTTCRKLVTREHRFLLSHLFDPTICCVVEQLAERMLAASASDFRLTAPIHSFCGCRGVPGLTGAILPCSYRLSLAELWYGCCFLIGAIVCLSEKDRTHRKPESS